MRRSFFFLLMVVLVLRGLTGTAMAAGMVAPLLPAGPAHQAMAPHHGHQGHQAAAAHKEQAEGIAHHGHDGHHMHHAAEAAASHAIACQDASAPGAGPDHHSASCSACEICHSAMLGLPASLTPPPLPAAALLPQAAAPFDSVPAALTIKPPIA